MIEKFGVHLLYDAYQCKNPKLGDSTTIIEFLNDLVIDLGMNKLTEPVALTVGEQNKKDPGGVSGFVMIAESHISIHTFPARQFVTADVYTCQNQIDEKRILEKFNTLCQTNNVDHQIIERGVNYPCKDVL